MKNTALRLDPRSGLLLVALVSIIAFTFQEPWLEFLTIGLLALLQLLCGRESSAAKWMALFVTLVLVQYVLLPVMPKAPAALLTISTVFARKVLPCLMMGSLLIGTIPVRYFIIALRKWKVPQFLIIPLAVTLRYFPAIGEERRHIRDAMKLKNIRGLGLKIQCATVPLLVSAIQTADELSAAAITRGIENPCPKTCAEDLRFSGFDWVCLCIAGILAVISLFFA